MQYIFEEQEYRDSLYDTEKENGSDSSEDDVLIEDNNILRRRLSVNKILLRAFHALEDFFRNQALDIGTLCRYSHFVEWIEKYVYIPDDENENSD